MPELAYQPALPRDRSVGIGCIGSGFIMTDCHLVAYRQAGFNPVAIASPTESHARQAADRFAIPAAYDSTATLLRDERVEVVDIAVPPDVQFDVIREVVAAKRDGRSAVRAVLAQKPLAVDYERAREIVSMCDEAGLVLAVNQNMRYDQSVRACKDALDKGYLGAAVLGTIDMRAVPHWASWQRRYSWLTLRIMSIHHLDCFRYWFGDPARVYASVTADPRSRDAIDHTDGICIYILEYDAGLRATACDDVWTGPDVGDEDPQFAIRWRVEGTRGAALGTIGWHEYPNRSPSTIDWYSAEFGKWQRPRWSKAWFPDAFAGPMAELLCALEDGREPSVSGRDNLGTMALVDACYRSAEEGRPVSLSEFDVQG